MSEKINILKTGVEAAGPVLSWRGAFAVQERSDWTARVAEIRFTPRKGYEPNAFHRLMQRLILGIRWERNSPNKE
jgi:hypothetical protein